MVEGLVVFLLSAAHIVSSFVEQFVMAANFFRYQFATTAIE